LRPKFAVAYTWRGYAYHKHRDFDRAIADYDRAHALDTKSVDTYVGRGMAYFAQRNVDRAEEDFSQALSLQPEDATALCSRGLARRDRGRPEAALAGFRTCLEHTDDPALHSWAAQQVQSLTAAP